MTDIWHETFWAIRDKQRNTILVSMEGQPRLYPDRELAQRILDFFVNDTGKEPSRFELIPVKLWKVARG